MEQRGSSFTFLHLSGCSGENMDQAPTRLGLEPQTPPGQSVTRQISASVEVNAKLSHLTNKTEREMKREEREGEQFLFVSGFNLTSTML